MRSAITPQVGAATIETAAGMAERTPIQPRSMPSEPKYTVENGGHAPTAPKMSA